MIVNVDGAIYKDSKWLLIKRGAYESHAPNQLSFVGGKVEEEVASIDALANTLKREVWEKIGITIEDNPYYVCSETFKADDGDIVLNILFLCTYPGRQSIAMNEQEVQEVYRLSTDEILSREDVPEFLKTYVSAAEKLLQKIEESNEDFG